MTYGCYESSAEARRTVMDMFPAPVTGHIESSEVRLSDVERKGIILAINEAASNGEVSAPLLIQCRMITC